MRNVKDKIMQALEEVRAQIRFIFKGSYRGDSVQFFNVFINVEDMENEAVIDVYRFDLQGNIKFDNVYQFPVYGNPKFISAGQLFIEANNLLLPVAQYKLGSVALKYMSTTGIYEEGNCLPSFNYEFAFRAGPHAFLNMEKGIITNDPQDNYIILGRVLVPDDFPINDPEKYWYQFIPLHFCDLLYKDDIGCKAYSHTNVYYSDSLTSFADPVRDGNNPVAINSESPIPSNTIDLMLENSDVSWPGSAYQDIFYYTASRGCGVKPYYGAFLIYPGHCTRPSYFKSFYFDRFGHGAANHNGYIDKTMLAPYWACFTRVGMTAEEIAAIGYQKVNTLVSFWVSSLSHKLLTPTPWWVSNYEDFYWGELEKRGYNYNYLLNILQDITTCPNDLFTAWMVLILRTNFDTLCQMVPKLEDNKWVLAQEIEGVTNGEGVVISTIPRDKYKEDDGLPCLYANETTNFRILSFPEFCKINRDNYVGVSNMALDGPLQNDNSLVVNTYIQKFNILYPYIDGLIDRKLHYCGDSLEPIRTNERLLTNNFCFAGTILLADFEGTELQLTKAVQRGGIRVKFPKGCRRMNLVIKINEGQLTNPDYIDNIAYTDYIANSEPKGFYVYHSHIKDQTNPVESRIYPKMWSDIDSLPRLTNYEIKPSSFGVEEEIIFDVGEIGYLYDGYEECMIWFKHADEINGNINNIHERLYNYYLYPISSNGSDKEAHSYLQVPAYYDVRESVIFGWTTGLEAWLIRIGCDHLYPFEDKYGNIIDPFEGKTVQEVINMLLSDWAFKNGFYNKRDKYSLITYTRSDIKNLIISNNLWDVLYDDTITWGELYNEYEAGMAVYPTTVYGETDIAFSPYYLGYRYFQLESGKSVIQLNFKFPYHYSYMEVVGIRE